MNRTPRLAIVLSGLIALPLTAAQAFADDQPGKPMAAADKMDMDKDMTDVELLQKIHAINVHEIEAGNMAQANASSKDVKDFGKKLAKDHEEADKKLTDVAKKLGVTLGVPSVAETGHEDLRAKTGVDFDRHFLIAMQRGHNDAILTLTCQAFSHPAAKDLQDYVKKSLSTLNDHRKHSIDLLEKLADKYPASS